MGIRKYKHHHLFFIGICLVAACFLYACNSAYKTTASQATVHNNKCAELWLLYQHQPHPMWQEQTKNIAITPNGFATPNKYKVYKINEDTLKAYFDYFHQQKDSVGMILPTGNSCEPFFMKLSGAMAEELQKKYPQIISIQGKGMDNKTADLRLDWNGTEMKGQLIYNGAMFFISPASSSEGPLYIIYNKDDSPELKQQFETKPAPRTFERQEKTYDR